MEYLHQVYPEDGNFTSPTVDFVFVHGLNSRSKDDFAMKTWSHSNGVFWPKDLLRPSLLNCRVLIFSYNSNVTSGATIQGIKQHAGNLLDRLKRKRDEFVPNSVPIIFIAHSLGGLVVKQVAVDANSARLGLGGRREKQVPMDNDHSGICKFGADDDVFEPVIGNVKELVKRFTGRIELLKDLHQHFEDSPDVPYILQGMGGSGLDAEFQKLKQMLSKDTNTHLIPEPTEWLGKQRELLIVFDNADDPVIDFQGCHVLFTTRDRRLSSAVGGAKQDIPMMSQKDSIDLFTAERSFTPLVNPSELHLIKDLVEKVGRLPLALSLAAALLRESPNISLSDYLNYFNCQNERIELLGFKQAFSNYNASVMTTWEISFNHVNDGNAVAADILQLLGFLHRDSIPTSILKDALKTKTIKINTEISIWQLEKNAALNLKFLEKHLGIDQAISLLHSLCLISLDQSSDKISLHPLVREWIRARLERKEKIMWVKRAMLLLYSQVSFPPLTDLLRPSMSTKEYYPYMQSIWDVVKNVPPDAGTGFDECLLSTVFIALSLVREQELNPFSNFSSPHAKPNLWEVVLKLLDWVAMRNQTTIFLLSGQLQALLEKYFLPGGFCLWPQERDLQILEIFWEPVGSLEGHSIATFVGKFSSFNKAISILLDGWITANNGPQNSTHLEQLGLCLFSLIQIVIIGPPYRLNYGYQKAVAPFKLDLYQWAHNVGCQFNSVLGCYMHTQMNLYCAEHLNLWSIHGPQYWSKVNIVFEKDLPNLSYIHDGEYEKFLHLYGKSLWECGMEDKICEFFGSEPIKERAERISQKWVGRVKARRRRQRQRGKIQHCLPTQ
ncbi:MAG: hypothetical protein M1834_006067 [Cirrosporium novae-zelandiae]|nr:MAG: hypothetical protein M1834_006067 [Cirrosporium novae-zelandiae]